MKRAAPAWLIKTPVAHRGLYSIEEKISENSIRAFEKAIAAGYDIELDVYVIADGEVVVFHDKDLLRMCGSPSLVTSLVTSDLDRYKLNKTDDRIPLFKDVLRLINGRVPLLIEIKPQPSQKEANMVILNALLGYKGEVAIQAFDPFTMSWFRKNAPVLIRGQLSSDFKDEKLHRVVKFLLKRFMLNFLSQPDFIAHDIRDAKNRRLKSFRKKGKTVLGWTVRNENEHRQAQPHFDNIIFELFQP